MIALSASSLLLYCTRRTTHFNLPLMVSRILTLSARQSLRFPDGNFSASNYILAGVLLLITQHHHWSEVNCNFKKNTKSNSECSFKSRPHWTLHLSMSPDNVSPQTRRQSWLVPYFLLMVVSSFMTQWGLEMSKGTWMASGQYYESSEVENFLHGWGSAANHSYHPQEFTQSHHCWWPAGKEPSSIYMPRKGIQTWLYLCNCVKLIVWNSKFVSLWLIFFSMPQKYQKECRLKRCRRVLNIDLVRYSDFYSFEETSLTE